MLSDCYRPRLLKKASDDGSLSVSNSFKVELGLILNASGSAYLELGSTKVICSVHGPHVSQRKSTFSNMGHLDCDLRYSSVSGIGDGDGVPPHTVVDAVQGSILLEKYSKSVISLNIVVLETAGHELAAIINCASLALANASIEMRDLVCASAVGTSENGVSIFPSVPDDTPCQSSAIVATIPTLNQVTQIVLDGKHDVVVVAEMIQRCVLANKELRDEFRQVLIENIQCGNSSTK